jgi:peptide/nickel transport system substrate-binding protein
MLKDVGIGKKARIAGVVMSLVIPYIVVSQGSPAVAAPDNTLNIITSEPTTGFDPAVARTQASLRVMELIYDTLIDYDSAGNLVPALAESWKITSGGTVVTFKLRSNTKFSDGSAITAEDVVFSLERAANSATMKSAYANMKSVRASGAGTVVVTLDKKDRTFLDTIATIGNSGILSKAAVSASSTYFLVPKATSGPWQLVSNIPQNRAKLEANPNYWRAGFPKIKTINYVYSSDRTSNASALEAGTQEMSFPMAPTDAIRLKKAGKIDYDLARGPTELFWGFNTKTAPFNDVRVRTAIAYAVPRVEKQEVCWEGIGPVSYGNVIHSGQLANPAMKNFQVDRATGLAKAQQLLTRAGWVPGRDGIRVAKGVAGVQDGTRLSFRVPHEANWQQSRCHTEMMSQFVKAAGIEALPQAFDGPTFWTEVSKGSFGMYHGGNGYPTIDAQFTNGYTCQGGAVALIARWCNPKFDELVTKAKAAPLGTAKRLYAQAELMLNKELPLILVGGQYNVVGFSTKLKGFEARFDSSNRGLITATIGN